jgi:hypothetical protein
MDSSELTPEEIPEPRAALPTDLDDDLFDFPTAEVQPAASDGMSVAKETALAIEASNEILVRKSQSARGPSDGSDLDEDIFSFGELFTDAESTAGDEVIAYYTEEEAEIETPPAPAGEDPSELAPAPVPAPEPAEIQSVAKPRKRARAARATAPKPVPSESGSRTPSPAPPTIAPVSPATSSVENRLVLTLALGFILVNAALIITAWQASESFQSTLDYVRTDLSSALTDMRVQGELHAAGPELGPGLAPETTPAPDANPAGQEPTPLASFQELELALAQEEIENGAYGDARIRLYRLLANVDRLVLDESQLADAEFLIGETYFAQGKSLPEEQP